MPLNVGASGATPMRLLCSLARALSGRTQNSRATMSVFSKLFGAPDRLQTAGRRLLPAAAFHATGLYVPVTDQFPELRSVSLEDWDFFVTVAGVQAGLIRLFQRTDEAQFDRISQFPIAALVARYPDG